MFKKILLLLTIIILASCNATKSPIVTKKQSSTKPKKSVVSNGKKTASGKTIERQSSQQRNSKTNLEVIESTSRTVVSNDIIGNYVLQYKDIAMKNMKTYGIPASIILAQGILESGAGRGDLAVSANNHFGIKCHTGWDGDSVRHDDDSAQECFRKYNDPGESFKDHSLFLTGRSRYANLFTLSKEDYKSWANGLRKAGYATDPKYPDKLISYIERYDLAQYDAQVLGIKYVPNATQYNRRIDVASASESIHEVQKGDTLYSISRKYNVLVDDLKQKNKLSGNTLSIGQRLMVR
ncbi:MAG: glucosaminidase domain-containing protein [Flavobacteriaceae bacterium]|jgi:flagellum-specific peptidoglycan hydrolase FlgJ|uniref:Peptidoglycan hydrolase n=1 Tax=Flavobacterium kayseriense TaxID=2764714 RepID=A0ABR7J2V8_9FLAO|nr:glucosaminidase domain-containing protein [Flavobacterium kayseriense]MBC5839900.1 glucosaminidase domain-containing protein [Flavobacterium kayseriense]MBC5847430.1 glucosaminidase domain-containing protein [Flavobacterium kayseriense]MBU0940104.1 glucosaminidase domain-containing protein [Bacteroidota bacterium]MBX9889318.1 glucosaminidase domain-containing protein [Flavobacteriaceae bacterium]